MVAAEALSSPSGESADACPRSIWPWDGQIAAHLAAGARGRSALPEPDTNAQMQRALAGLREMWKGAPHISEADFDAALAASREELEARTIPT